MTHLCVPIFVKDAAQARRDAILAAEAGADIVELRIDSFTDPNSVAALVNDFPVPCIVTCRPPSEGGQSMLNVNRPRGDPLKEPVDEFATAYTNADLKPTIISGLAWDPAKIVVAALRRLGPNATGAQLHTYLEGLHDFAGTGGIYDFRTGDQHGLTQSAVIVVRWDAARSTYVVVSRQGGAPLPAAGAK